MLIGEVDMSNFDALESVMESALPFERMFDLSACSFFDHRALLAVDRAAHHADTRVTLVGASRTVLRIWELLGPANLVVER